MTHTYWEAYTYCGVLDGIEERWNFSFPHDVQYIEDFVDEHYEKGITVTKPCGCTLHLNCQTHHTITCGTCESVFTDEELKAFDKYMRPWYHECGRTYRQKERNQ